MKAEAAMYVERKEKKKVKLFTDVMKCLSEFGSAEVKSIPTARSLDIIRYVKIFILKQQILNHSSSGYFSSRNKC